MPEQRLPQIKGVLMDLWGTLAYNIPHRNRQDFEKLGQQVGMTREDFLLAWAEFNLPTLRGQIKTGEERARRVLAKLNRPLEFAPLIAEFEYYQRAAEVHLFPQVPEMLTHLRQNGYHLALISNCNYLTRDVVERLGLPALLDEVILSFEVGLVKPEVEIYQLGAARLGLTTEDCLFIGDGGDGELDGALEAGCLVALVEQERGHAYRFPAKNYNPHLRLAQIADLAQKLPGRSAA